jgi:aspartyl-tRNA synthetase
VKRTALPGELRTSDVGSEVRLAGWVARRRDHGNLIFVDLRDRSGLVQLVFDPRVAPAAHRAAEGLRPEYVVSASGAVVAREPETVNAGLPTGEIEVRVAEVEVLAGARTPPFEVEAGEGHEVDETLRLKYRYLDIRRPEMLARLELRHRAARAAREYLSEHRFLEIETPLLTRSSPEGARDFLVPSRLQPHSFYALPQSPQMFKQILMVGGVDRYYQLVHCFRDEDLRADRQPEFTQIDLEMSYPQQERVWEVVEKFLTAAFKAAGHEIKTPFPRMSYDEAIRLYGSDKPDMRLPEMTDVREAFAAADFEKLGVNAALPLLAIRIPKVGKLSRKERDENKELFGVQTVEFNLLYLDRLEKSMPDAAEQLKGMSSAHADDLIALVGARHSSEFKTSLGGLGKVAGAYRLRLADKYREKHKAFERTGDPRHDFRFLWVTDFPMFEYDEEGKSWVPAHHPFTSPHEKDMDKLQSDPGAVRALAYDVVLNGTELGSGSIRIHRQDIQRQIFRALGMTEEEARARFGFFLEALEYGTPPHGGIALGLDRIAMILAGADSLREVIPFPKTARAVDLMVDAPTPVSEAQLKELGIQVKK